MQIAVVCAWGPPAGLSIANTQQCMVGIGLPPNRRRRRPLLAGRDVPVDEPLGVLSQNVVRVERLLEQLARDVLGHVARPALGGVEGDHANRVRILATQEIADGRLAISLGGVGLVVGEAVLPVVIQYDINGEIPRRLRHAAGHGTHSHTNSDSTPTIWGRSAAL
jgi:hypothetical protein